MTLNKKNKKYQNTRGGFVILYAVLLSTIVLTIGLSLLGILVQQVSLSGTGRESSTSFYVADSGMECALFWDLSADAFMSGGPPPGTPIPISCNGASITPIRGSDTTPSPPSPPLINWNYTFKATFPDGCASISVTKTVDPTDPDDPIVATTTVESRGYNTVCPPTASTKAWRLERGLQTIY